MPGHPPCETPELGSVRDAAVHVLEPHLVGLIVGNEMDRGVAISSRSDPMGQVEDRDLLSRADIEHLPRRVLVIEQLDDGLDDIGYMTEAAGLPSVAKDCDGVSRKG